MCRKFTKLLCMPQSVSASKDLVWSLPLASNQPRFVLIGYLFPWFVLFGYLFHGGSFWAGQHISQAVTKGSADEYMDPAQLFKA